MADSQGGGGNPAPITRRISKMVTAFRPGSSEGTRTKSRLQTLAAGESIKERQQKLKEEREAKRNQLDGRHNYLLDTVAIYLNLDFNEVVDHVLEGNQIDKIEEFLSINGSHRLMFFYQDDTTESAVNFELPSPATSPSRSMDRRASSIKPIIKQHKTRLFVTDGRDVSLQGICMFFLRPSTNKAITQDSITKEVTFTVLDASDDGLLTALEKLLSHIIVPSVKTIKSGWGELDRPASAHIRQNFLNQFDNFVNILSSAQQSLDDAVNLSECTTFELSRLRGPSDYLSVAASSESMEKIEACMAVWIKQIAQVLAESDQMRKEADNIGPRAELEHWKKRMARFNNLLTQIKSNQVKAVLGCLQAAKSKTLKTWFGLDQKITEYANEAKDNVKYLYTLEKFCEPLYTCDPVGMVDAIPGLVNAIRMIHSISGYYNTSERMTSLFVKVTNQMVTSCKAYITNTACDSIWIQPREELIDKLKVCVRLNQEYQRVFQKTKQKLEQTPEERQFDFSEMYVFGKFDTFQRRLNKIIDMFDLIEMYSHLADSRIEGMELMGNRFQVIVTTMKKKPYDPLDQRRQEFDVDYDEFKRQIGELQASIKTFMDQMFDRIFNTQRALYHLKKFDRLGIPNLGISEKYARILLHYGRDIENTVKQYQKHKNEPPVARDLPPIAGKIMWARQLFRRVQEPMEVFQQHANILQGTEAKRIIKNYNRLAKTLLEFEMLYHRGWLRQVEVVKSGLNSSLLVRHPETNELYVNFDPAILVLIRETECMLKLGLSVPPIAKSLVRKQSYFKELYNRLQLVLVENSRVRERIQQVFQLLMTPHANKLDEIINPGLNTLTWTSMNIDLYINDIYEGIAGLNLLIERANDLCNYRIDAVLQEMATTTLCQLPEDDPWTVDEFLAHTKILCAKGIHTLQLKSQLVEEATNELIELLLELPPEMEPKVYDTGTPMITVTENELTMEDRDSTTGSQLAVPQPPVRSTSSLSRAEKKRREMREHLEEEACELLNYFNHRNLDALLKVTRSTLDSLRRRITSSTMVHYLGAGATESKSEHRPFFRCNVTLVIPQVAMLPALDEVQQSVNKVAHCIIGVSKGVSKWSKQRRMKEESRKPHVTFEDPELTERRHSLASGISESSDSLRLRRVEIEGVLVNIPTQTNNYFKNVAENKEIAKLASLLSTSINSTKKEVTTAMEAFDSYSDLWQEDREESLTRFLEDDPKLSDFQAMIINYKDMEIVVNELAEFYAAGPIALYTEQLKIALSTETKNWILGYGKACNEKYRSEMENIFTFIDDVTKRLSRPIKDLDDIRFAMATLRELRENEIRVDMSIGPIEESYAMLARYECLLAKEEVERVDTIRYSWEKLQVQSIEIQSYLVNIQPNFRGDLLENVITFGTECNNFFDDYKTTGPMVPGLLPREASDRLIIFQNKFDSLYRKYVTYTGGEELFGLPVTEYPELLQIKKELTILQKLYSLYNSVIDTVNSYYDILWTDVNIEKINSELLDFQNRCRKLPKALKEYQAFNDLKKTIDDFNETCPLLELMANKAMKLRHWQKLAEVTQCQFDIESDAFCLRNIMEAPLLENKEDIEDICIAAVKERDIEAKLKQCISDWNIQTLLFGNFKNRGELLLKGDNIIEITALMEDSLMVLSSLLSNRYNAPFKKQIQQWVHNLTNSADIIETWMTVQNLWVYLEAVFVGGDIAKQLPKEAKRFSNIDKSWVKIMTRAHEIPNVISCCVGDETLGQLLPHLLEQLELCQKSLTGYLEKKRLLFPRFFFVSDPALLEILGQASDSHTIQNHLLSIFDNIKNVKFHEKDYDRIMSIISSEGETVELERPVKADGNVEIWLMNLLMMSQKSLHGVIRTAAMAIQDSSFNIIEFIDTYPAQVGLLGLQMIWTRDSTDALTSAKSDRKIMENTDRMFLQMLNTLIEMTTKELSRFERTKYETLITIHVHQKDIFSELIEKKIRIPSDFEWLKQSRFYFNEDIDKCQVQITDVEFVYQNEFLGCTERLVITPLTDRCYITLAQALGMSMGGAPAGPAGTGKTETVKDMGRALGKYVVVFNCSDQMDYRGLGRIYKGLAQSGSWGCFDEFNRIDLPVLSVAAQQIAIVLACRRDRKKQFIFTDGDLVDLNPEFGMFITMNPGYAGRQELPENLKINFRTVAMMVPDRKIIICVKLASVGFKQNKKLAEKFYTLYKLCEEQLTKQVHYDFGLRNILSVLRTLGAVKRETAGTMEEQDIVMRVLRDMNLSKLVDEDEPLFMSLINDLFPGTKLDKSGYPELENAIAKQVDDAGLINHPAWKLKVIQLFETQRVRHGMMTLGPTGSGKTCCIHILMKSMTDCGEPHREMRMNPKAITAPQMFGRLDVATNDWTDGIFSTLWRKTLRAKKAEHVWLVLDGPVDAIWIENLNSVLDDNKTLTLANGDRIPMSPNCKIIFEPDNVDNASPATVSRNGMVFMSSSIMDWSPILKGWLKTRNGIEADTIERLFTNSFTLIYNFVIQNVIAKMPVLECIYVRQCVRLLEGLIPPKEEREQGNISAKHMERLYVFCLMWSYGALLEWEDRIKLEVYIRTNSDFKLDVPVIEEGSSNTMFDFLVDTDGSWLHWDKRVEEYIYPTDYTPDYSSILVPNVDNVRTEFLIHTIAKQSNPVLLIGEQGTAKTVMALAYMNKFDPEMHLMKSFNFSSATTPLMFQRTIESYVDKRMGSTYGPPAGKKMTVFIDDVNMPIINEWGDQVTNEIVRQNIESGGFYNLEKPGDFTTIVDIQFIAAMIQPGGGRNDIPMRLKRHFTIFNCTLPSNPSIDKIFSVIASGHFHALRKFKADIQQLAKDLVPITRRLWQLTKIKMLPTPAKFHYVFNLRDLSRIWEGMLNTDHEVITKPKLLLGLWKHECCRVIADRFTEVSDTEWFMKTIERVIIDELGEEWEEVIADDAFFVDFMQDAPEATGEETDDADFEAPKVYEPIESFDILQERLKMFMTQYNETVRGTGMDLVFFRDAMLHLMRISRVIRTPRGHYLLVGVGGSGKQSLTKLSSFIAGYKTFQITMSRAYNVSNLMEDLKYLYRVSGLQGQGITFIFTDNDIKDEAFLEYLNNVLSSGEVSNLFARDELDEITQELIPIMKREHPRRPPTPENLYDYFLSRARHNLHITLCFSPVGEKFRNRALKFPGLISGCTMDWFQRWPKDALVAVANHFVGPFKMVCEQDTKTQIMASMGSFHDGVAESCVDYFHRFRRATHVTPKSYLSFINSYKTVYGQKYKEIGDLATRMNTGLDKLVEASASVAELSVELAQKEKELAVASAKAEEVLQEVTKKAAAAEKVKAQVQTVKDKAQAIYDSIMKDKTEAEGKLLAAKPALEEAERALQTIKPTDISTVRKLGKPPHLIMRIMDCVLILFRRRLDSVTADPERPCPKPSWGESLKFMMAGGMLQALLDYPKDNINEEMVEMLTPYIDMEDFNVETAKKVCGNVAGLCSWTKAMAFFFTINKEVLPLKDNLAVQEKKLQAANADLETAQAQLDAKQRELDVVKAQYDAAMAEKQELVENANRCRRKMEAASALINGLGGEKERWTQQSKEFEAQIRRLVGDVLLSSAFLSYSGPFNQEYRSMLSKNWSKEMKTRKIPFTADLNLIDMLTDPATIGEWNLQGLPNDELSIQNGIIVTSATRFPLLIDPQGQGKVWIKNREGGKELQLTSLNHKYFRNHLEDSLSLGRALLIEDIGEELDPALDNVLEKNFIKTGSTFKVKVGDKEVDIMTGFVLYITTKLANPVYTPEVSAQCAIIDFTVTMKGLEEQLLGRVIGKEKAELETERTKLMEDVTANKRTMKQLEDNLLYRLTSTQGSLVDDESLITVLSDTKRTAEEVSQKLTIAAETSQKIDAAREEFRPVATRGSILYFLIVEMSLVNCMYQTSLRQFLGLFDLSMEKSTKSPITTKRIHNIIDFLTYEVFKYAARGLYEEHKFLFTLLLTLKIDLQAGRVKHEEFATLIKGGASLDLNAVQPKPCKWVLDITWLNLVELSKLPHFREILNQVTNSEKQWKQWFDKEAPEEEIIPDGYNQAVDTFRRLLLIRSWCPDRTLSQARKYICESMGEVFAEGVILDIEKMFDESDCRTPLICLLSMGSDPTSNIEAIAKRKQIDCKAISMGQGQEVHARRLLQQQTSQGGWTMLQNCHLSLLFLTEVIDLINDQENIHPDFRLWMTTEIHPQFPITLLQMGIKYTNEPPTGIKPSLKRTYVGISQDLLEVSNMPQWKPMLYAVGFLHTTVQERRKFGPLGWNIPYEFNQSDFNATVQFVQNHLDDMDLKRGVSWNTVRYMIGEVQYGGRVTDDYDKILLNTFSKVWFTEGMFLPTFKFYKNYTIPKCTTIPQYIEAINQLPVADTPEAFGLHPNADITYQSNKAKDVLLTILSIQPKDSSSGGGETRESVVSRMANDMLQKLPADYIGFEVKSRLVKMGQYQPMNIFLRQEIDRMQRVIMTVRTTLNDLKLAIDGTIIMSENLRDALDCMFDAMVPALWAKISWVSSTLGFWFTELLERDHQFRTWCFEGRPNTFWMTGFFNPQGFLTAMKQEVTRAQKGWALDEVILATEVTRSSKEEIMNPPSEGVFVYGLYLDGAGWDRRGVKLVEPRPKVLFELMPVIRLYAVLDDKEKSGKPVDKTKDGIIRTYMCPVYKKPTRTDLSFIAAVDLRTSQHPDHWVLRGVALLCDVK